MALMIWLGFWQLRRLQWKNALLARYAANQHLPTIALPPGATDDALLFRHATATCTGPVSWTTAAGRDARGRVGWRQIAHCAAPARLSVQVGVSQNPDARPTWSGGSISGIVSHTPSDRPLIADAFRHGPPVPLMLVADRPLPGLDANAAPDMASIPNNHLSYAVQWFLFAAVAVVIYIIALSRRWRAR
ncbi:MAG: SURF1 family protein [Sphingomonas sp.]